MSFLKVLLCVLLLASPVLSETSQPNCTGVKDFEDCRGDTNEFCPKDILCQCKNEKPFCRCDYYRIGWKEYWYMGPKCNHLWNTLTFILVATLPAAALVILVLVIFLTVYCSKAEKAGRQPKPAPSGAQQNPAFSPDTAADLEHGHHQPAGDTWVGQIPKVVLKKQDFNDASFPNQKQNYSHVYDQPLRTADPSSDYFPQSRAQRDEFDYPRKDLPYPVYPEARQYRRY
uniref:EGF-like domain-containing protein n=1 Tax=Ficedula albicollis TaxID=59894 RepID=A0A803V9E7_FICAL